MSNSKHPLAWILATGFGSGLIGFAPGTWGSVVGVGLLALLSSASLNFFVWAILFVLGCAVAVWSAGRVSFDGVRDKSKKIGIDDSRIVIDEIMGMWIAGWMEPLGLSMVLAFCFFRFFDIVKPPPISILDRWSKKQTGPWRLGWGILADDLLAGLMARGMCMIVMAMIEK